MRRQCMRWMLIGGAVAVATCSSAVGDGTHEDAAAARVRALRRQVEENDRQIRALEAIVRRLQGRTDGARPNDASQSEAPSTAAQGQISAWTSALPATAAHAVPSSRPGTADVPITAHFGTPPTRNPRGTAAVVTPRVADRLDRVILKRGMSQARVWDLAGPPEFVRGRRQGVQYWHYGAGWIRFQAGRVTRWQTATAAVQARAAGR